MLTGEFYFLFGDFGNFNDELSLLFEHFVFQYIEDQQ